jgi:hypothetical protein
MTSTSELHETVKRMLASQTFEPDELAEVLVQQGHAKADVSAAIAEVSAQLEEEKRSPAVQRAAAYRRGGVRLLQIGIMILVVGLGFTLFQGGGNLQLMLVIAVGGAFLGAGYRRLRSS